MKYRLLTTEELEFFEDELKQFLIVNGFHDKEWREINKTDKSKAKSLVGVFSDTILQKVYQKIQYIEHRSETSFLIFKFNKEKINLISLNRKSGKQVNFSTPELIQKSIVKYSHQITYFKKEKSYTKEREMEIHEMIEGGCVNSTKEFWELLSKSI